MKKTITLITLLFITIFSFSQSANLDREYFNVSYVKLPSKPILDNSKRTFSTNKRAISLSGFSRVKNNGTLDINYTFNGTSIGEVDIKKTKHEKKNKEGEVTSVSYTYKVHVTYSSRATVSVSNSENPENNYENNFSDKTNYESNTFSTYKAAQNHYNNNRHNLRSKYSSAHKKSILSNINSRLNSVYGYSIYSTKGENFWILGKKKHPEYQKHMEAYENMKVAFEKMKYDEPIATLKTELQPTIDYFNSLVPKYVGKKKRMVKMRYASFYNIAKMYYYLDMPEKTKEYAQKLIDNGYDKSDGKYLIRKADELISKFDANKSNTRHFEVLTEDLTNVQDEVENEESEETAPNLEVVKAYLISKAGDTTLVDMEIKYVDKIAYEVKTVKYNNEGNPIGSDVKNAKEFNEVLFVDGTHYKNVTFKESSIKGDAVSTGKLLAGAKEKLCKVIVESDKINLYLFNNEEPVILTPNTEKGKSTLSTGFVFGFKKKLSKLAEGNPDLIKRVKDKEFKNNITDLTKFCEELSK